MNNCDCSICVEYKKKEARIAARAQKLLGPRDAASEKRAAVLISSDYAEHEARTLALLGPGSEYLLKPGATPTTDEMPETCAYASPVLIEGSEMEIPWSTIPRSGMIYNDHLDTNARCAIMFKQAQAGRTKLRAHVQRLVREWPFCPHANAPVALRCETGTDEEAEVYNHWGEFYCPHCAEGK